MDSQISCHSEQSGVPSHRKKNFTPKAALLWDIHDFPAYGLVTSWRTHGKLVCPICASSRIKSTRVASQLVWSAREDRLERENNRLRLENKHCRVRSLAEKGEVDFDALMRSAAPGMATPDSEVGFERGRDAVAQDETELGLKTNTGGSHRRDKDLDMDNDEHDLYGDEGDEYYGNVGDEDYGNQQDDHNNDD